jgi:hypothetical protein
MFRSQHQERSPFKKHEDHPIPGLGKRPRVINPAWHRIATHISSSHSIPAVQPKLKIGAPNDKYEQEADRVADQVMRAPQEVPLGCMPDPAVQRKPG